MKEAKQIISHIKSNPQFKKLSQYSLANRLKSLLPHRFSQFIKVAYIKNNTFFMGVTHPAIKTEINYNLSLIKALLNKLDDIEEKVLDVKIFLITTFYTPKETNEPQTEPFYKERATGNFENRCEDKKLREKFEIIKELICSNSK